jgi:hypothetical protein
MSRFVAGGCCLLAGVLMSGYAAHVAAAPNPFSDSGTFDFDTDPGFTIVDGGNPNVVANVRTADSVMELKMTRDGAVERVNLPITSFPANNEDHFRVRMRFGVIDQQGSGADIIAGFFSSSEGNFAGGSTTGPIIEAPGADNSPARLAGGAYDRLSETHPLNAWHIYDFEFRAVGPEVSRVDLLDGDGNFLYGINPGATSGMDNTINLIGFGNEERSDAADSLTVLVDWLVWSVNEALPPDPANASNSLIPEPTGIAIFGFGVFWVLSSRRPFQSRRR